MKFLAAALLLILAIPVGALPPGVNLPAADTPPGGTTQIEFVCPEGDPTQVSNSDVTDRTILGCPIRVYDTLHFFGNPQLSVRADDPREIMFSATHGDKAEGNGAGATGPFVVQEHVTFTTSDQGLSWDDQPTGMAGQADGPSNAFDSQGRIYLAYPSHRTGDNSSAAASTLLLYATSVTAAERGGLLQEYQGGHQAELRLTGNHVSRVRVIDMPPSQAVAETLGNASAPENGTLLGELASRYPPPPGELVAATWLETTRGDGPRGMRGWIDIATYGLQGNSTWTQLPDASLIGPCLDASNPGVHDGKLYIGCIVGPGYGARRGARIGDLDIWVYDPAAGAPKLAGFSGLRGGGHPLLAVNADGYMAVTLDRPRGEALGGGQDVQVAFGWYGRQWTASYNLGTLLHQIAGGPAPRFATVAALAIAQDKTLALIYNERQPTTAQQPKAPTIDPNNPPDPANLAAVRLTEYRKVMLTANECTGPIAAAAFTTGTGLDAYQIEAYQQDPDFFNDTQEGLVAYTDPVGGGEMFYFAVNDYGAMQFGGARVAATSSPCFVPPPVPATPPVATPQALSIVNPASTLVGATVGAASLAMVGYLLAVKRRAPSRVAAKQK